MKLIPYEPWHYEYLAGLTGDAKSLGLETTRLLALAYSLRGDAVSIQEGDQVVGCAGILEMWPGVGEAWSVFSDGARRPFFLHRRGCQFIKDVMQRRQYHRVQSVVKEDDTRATCWITRLGFIKESIMKRFGADKSDFGMYVLGK